MELWSEFQSEQQLEERLAITKRFVVMRIGNWELKVIPRGCTRGM